MQLEYDVEPHDVLVVRLVEGDTRTELRVHPAAAGAVSLTRAVDAALADGYGECFWPAASGGQYWWIFKSDGIALEMIAMWTRGGASLWEHVFRATDAPAWVRDRVAGEAARLGLVADR